MLYLLLFLQMKKINSNRPCFDWFAAMFALNEVNFMQRWEEIQVSDMMKQFNNNKLIIKEEGDVIVTSFYTIYF